MLPAIVAGTPIDSGLEHAALFGIVAFVLFAGFGAAVLMMERPLRWAGDVFQAARNRLKRKSEPMTGLPDRLVYERNRIREVLGRRWKAALLLSSGRLAFDFLTLLACIRATGVKLNPSLVLLAYAVAGLLELVPATPGGLGIVEAGLSGMPTLAGTPAGRPWSPPAYRIISYWLPIVVGPVAYSCSGPGTAAGSRRWDGAGRGHPPPLRPRRWRRTALYHVHHISVRW